MRIRFALTLLIVVLSSGLHADDSPKVAILEFQNDSGTIITTNRWTMADDLGKRLRKKDKSIQLVSRKDILKNLKELSWEDGRLSRLQERQLAELGAHYAIYGRIVHWRLRGIYSNPDVQDAPEATVIFAINMIDLKTGATVKLFRADGGATGETGHIREGDPSAFPDDDPGEEMYDATEMATIKAADILAKMISK